MAGTDFFIQGTPPRRSEAGPPHALRARGAPAVGLFEDQKKTCIRTQNRSLVRLVLPGA